MNILDIDLDFFLHKRPTRHARIGRLSSNNFHPWSIHEVVTYLEKRCNLNKERPLHGAVVTYHHELFDVWKSLIESGNLEVPFHLTHIDSHADMGMGDSSPGYIMGDLLHRDPSARVNPKRGGHDGLSEGNFISFSIACRWISSITYVHHSELRNDNCGMHDIPDCLFRENKRDCGIIELKKLSPECQKGIPRIENCEPIALEPEVPIRIIDVSTFQASDSFSFVFAAHSPRYTPATSDRLLVAIRQFIQEI